MSFAVPAYHKLEAAVAIGALGVGLSACGADANSVAGQARSGNGTNGTNGTNGKGFVSGDGSIERVARERRSGPLTLSGTTVQGARWKVADARDRVLVLNVWGQWRGPCLAEMPHLQRVWSELSAAGKPVQFHDRVQRDHPSPGQAAAGGSGGRRPR